MRTSLNGNVHGAKDITLGTYTWRENKISPVTSILIYSFVLSVLLQTTRKDARFTALWYSFSTKRKRKKLIWTLFISHSTFFLATPNEDDNFSWSTLFQETHQLAAIITLQRIELSAAVAFRIVNCFWQDGHFTPKAIALWK